MSIIPLLKTHLYSRESYFFISCNAVLKLFVLQTIKRCGEILFFLSRTLPISETSPPPQTDWVHFDSLADVSKYLGD